MKIFALVSGGYDREYVCTVKHSELEKYLNLYYDKLKSVEVGDTIDLGRGYDFASQIASAMHKTQEFVQANQAVVTAILNGLNYANISAASAPIKACDD